MQKSKIPALKTKVSIKRFEAAILDADGTLTMEMSWTAMTKAMGASVQEHLRIYRELKQGKITYEESKTQLLPLWQKTGNANKPFLQELFQNFPIKPEALKLIQHLKAKSYRLCLITGSVDLYAQILAKRLGIPHYFSNTELVWDENGNLVDYHYDFAQGPKKLQQFQAFCQKHHLDPKACLVLGNDDNDGDLFLYTGNGILVSQEETHVLKNSAWKKVANLLEAIEFT